MNSPRTLTPVPPPSAWQRVAEVPHRAYFSAGILSLIMLALWWSMALPMAAMTSRPATLVHGLLMPLGIFPPFMLGFVFTAGPRWLGAQAPGGHLPLALAQVTGLLLTLLGFAAGGYWPLFGLFVMFIAWWWATWLWFSCINSVPQADQRHARCILVAMLLGNVALLTVIAWVLTDDGQVWLLARNLIVWGWIVPIFLTVAHRMLPFFTQSVLPQRVLVRSLPLLYLWLIACVALALASAWGRHDLVALVAAALCLSSAHTAWQWAGKPRLQWRGACGGNRLLTMLHLSFAWLPLALLLEALGGFGLAVGSAPVHALGLGFCSTLLVAFVTRVTLGHSGLPLQAQNAHWYLYLGLHALAIARVVQALNASPPVLLHGTAAVWLLLLLIWAAYMLPAYWRPRADGKPG